MLVHATGVSQAIARRELALVPAVAPVTLARRWCSIPREALDSGLNYIYSRSRYAWKRQQMTYSLGVWQATLATVYVADKVRRGDVEFVPTSRLADDLAIPAPSLSRLLRALSAAGIIETREGARGGVRLARDPSQVSLLDIVKAIDGETALFRTDTRPRVEGRTPEQRQRAIRGALGDAEAALRASLREVTIESISER